MDEAVDAASKAINGVANRSVNLVRENPEVATGILAGVGLYAGWRILKSIFGSAKEKTVNAAKKMCATGDLNWPGLQNVNPGSRAEACAAVSRWNAMKASARAKRG